MRRILGAVFVTLLAATPGWSAPLRAAAGLARALGPAGRAEATLRFTVPGAAREVQAALALEPPDRARIDLGGSGEKLVVRRDGGEWVQPSLQQVLRYRANQVSFALRWWRVLLGSESAARERRIASRGYVLSLPASVHMPADSAEVWLDARGLPVRLVVPAGDPEAIVFRLGAWRFPRARGEGAFHLATPAGFEVVDLP